jgi:hypothetical protein
MNGAVPLLPTYTFMTWTGTPLLLLYFCITERKKKTSVANEYRSYTKILHSVPPFSQLVSNIKTDLLV